MPRRPHGGDETGPGRGRPNVSSVRAGEDAVEDAAHAGRAGAGGRATGGQPDHFVTRMTGEAGGVPAGPPTYIKPKEDAKVRRSLEMENAAAKVLADSGYRVEQNPTADQVARARAETGDTGRPSSKPDYLLEGRVFDCYSPTKPTKNARGIWSEVEEKIVDSQTQRVVVNLQDWRGDMSAIRRQFHEWPIDNLKEVKAITPDGDIVQIIPKP